MKPRLIETYDEFLDAFGGPMPQCPRCGKEVLTPHREGYVHSPYIWHRDCWDSALPMVITCHVCGGELVHYRDYLRCRGCGRTAQ